MQEEASGTEWPCYKTVLKDAPASEETKLEMINKVPIPKTQNLNLNCTDVESREPCVHGSFSAHDDGRPCTFSQVFVLAMLEENIHD